MTPCALVYLDLGTNIGDSLDAFAFRKPEERLAETLGVAVGWQNWSPSTTCAYGFEPNPQWSQRLRSKEAKLRPLFANLTVFTETAIGGP